MPVDDLAAIYARLGKSLSTWQMKYCIVRLRSVLLAAAVEHFRIGLISRKELQFFLEGIVNDHRSCSIISTNITLGELMI